MPHSSCTPSAPVSVLVVAPGLEAGHTGWARQTGTLLTALRGQPIDFHLPSEHSLSLGRRGPGFGLSRLSRIPRPGATPAARLVEGLLLAGGVARIARRYDVVYCPNLYFPVPLVALAASARGARVVVRAAQGEFAIRGVGGRLRARCCSAVAAIVVQNRQTEEDLLEQGISPTRIQRIPNGVDTARFAPGAPHAPRPDSMLTILCVGAVCPRKGALVLVRAFAQVRANHPQTRLLLVGPYNEGESRPEFTCRLRDELSQTAASDAVRWVGRVDDVRQYHREADLFVLPSLAEGMPNALLEAMSAGLPCVATAIPGIVDVVRPDTTGLLVRAGDETALADALSRLIACAPLRRRLGRAARRQAVEELSVGTMARRYRELFVRVADRELGGAPTATGSSA